MPKIVLKNIHKSYGKRIVVKGLSAEFLQGYITVLLGANGAGKTTAFEMITGAIAPDEGEIYFDSQKITKFPLYKRSRIGIGYLPQEHSIFNDLTTRENILLGLEFKHKDRKKIKNICDFIISEFGLEKVQHSLACNLSGGEKRKLETGRAVANQPKFLLVDEPLAGVDPKSIEEIQKTLIYLKEQKNIGIIFTDHNALQALAIADYVYIMYDGEFVFSGSVEEVVTNKEAKEKYFGNMLEQLKRK